MRDSGEMIVQWLDAVLPDWYGLASGVFTGILGILALGLMACFLAPQALGGWMLLIVFFCSVSAGYKFWERRRSVQPALKILFCLATGTVLTAAAIGIYAWLLKQFLHVQPAGDLYYIFAALALSGVLIGAGLRKSYEKLPGEAVR